MVTSARRIFNMFGGGLQLIKESVAELLFPPLCGFCDRPIKRHGLTCCPECQRQLRSIPAAACGTCGIPLSAFTAADLQICGRCLSTPPPYQTARYGYYYETSLRQGILRFKYAGHLHLADLLGGLLIEEFRRHYEGQPMDLIVPVPIHSRRIVHRGFNQSVVLSERLAAATGLPVERKLLVKTKDTPPQATLGRTERLKNLAGSFSVRHAERLRDKSILLVDDVATTGSTITEASKTIMKAGAGKISVLVLSLRRDDLPQGPQPSYNTNP